MSQQTPNNTDGDEELNKQLIDQCKHPNPHIAVVKSLLERNADERLSVIVHCIKSRNSPESVKAEGLKLFNYLLENHRDSFDLERGYGDYEFHTPVIYACRYNSVPILKTLVEKYNVNLQPNPNDPNFTFTSAIFWDATGAVDYLLTNHRHLFDINAFDDDLTPFLYCCKWEHVHSVITLLKHGADYSIKSVNQSLGPMDLLLLDDDYEGKIKNNGSHFLYTISALVTAYPHVFDVNCTVDALRNGNKCSALLLASHDDNIDLVKVLVYHGANLDVEDIDGLNIVHYAAQSIGTEVLSDLFETHLQSTHQHLATAFTKPTDTIHAMDPVMMACKYSRFETAELFTSRDDFDVLRQTNNIQFEFGQTTNREPQQSRTLLHLACDYHPAKQGEPETPECPDLVELLIEKVVSLVSS